MYMYIKRNVIKSPREFNKAETDVLTANRQSDLAGIRADDVLKQFLFIVIENKKRSQ